MIRRAAALFLLVCGGCAGGRTYPTGINHAYLCAVRSARANGYQIRAQEFKAAGGTLVAARSTPDPKATPIGKGWVGHLAEVFRNVWERGTVELWDEDVAAARLRTERRVTAKFKANQGWLGFGKKQETRVSLAMDVTDYGREDWVIQRHAESKETLEAMYRAIGDCLVVVAPRVELASPAPSATATSAGEGTPAAAGAPAQDFSDSLGRGRKAYEDGKFADVVAILKPVADADPQNAEALGYLGASYYRLKRRDEAIAAYERYVSLVPSDVRSREFLEDLKKGP